jgi:heme-degrading monooxygenase HmoA
MKQDRWTYVIIWEFYVPRGREARFEEVYGPRGNWAKFFASDQRYCGTELNRDNNKRGRYVTLDFWTSRQAYLEFRKANEAEYIRLDQECQSLTEGESELSSFERIFPGA